MHRPLPASLSSLNSTKPSTKQVSLGFFRQQSLKSKDNKWLGCLVLIIYAFASILFNIFHIISDENHDKRLSWIGFSLNTAAACGIVLQSILEVKNSKRIASSLRSYFIFILLLLCFSIFKLTDSRGTFS